MLLKIASTAALLGCAAVVPAAAQFNQFVGFGDSTVDSGWYRNTTTGNADRDARIAAAVAAGGRGAPVGVGLMSPEALAAYFGLSALPANQGGTNFATGGALNDSPTLSGNTAAVPTVAQISNYLAATGGRANASALYLIGTGGNDILAAAALPAAQQGTTITAAANSLVGGIRSLSAAGARYIIVPNQAFGPAAQQGLRTLYDGTVWSGLAAAGVQFIPADANAAFRAVQQNPAQFGVTLGPGTPGPNTPSACVAPAGVTSGWGVLCAPQPTLGGTTATLAAPGADQTRLFVDDLHLSAVGQKILADYYRNLVTAPAELSLLAETPLKSRAGVIAAIGNQIDVSRRRRGPNNINVWLTGDVSSVRVNNATGFSDASATPAALSGGIDVKVTPWLLFGAALSVGAQKATFSLGGSYRQDEVAGSIYAGVLSGPWWLNGVATYGGIKYGVDRTVAIGITQQANTGSTQGSNISVAVEGGYDFIAGPFRHGPVAGLTWQTVRVDGFTETGSFTSLAFGGQTRDSLVSALGYRAEFDAGMFRPFVKAVWNHELATTDRSVTASLTTIAAPSYAMPAVDLGRDWASGTVGVAANWTPNVTALVAAVGQVGQRGAKSVGGQAGVNVAF